jgi:hypothetical protein
MITENELNQIYLNTEQNVEVLKKVINYWQEKAIKIAHELKGPAFSIPSTTENS